MRLCAVSPQLGMFFLMLDELFPLFAKTPVAEGGLGFGSSAIGIAITVSGVALVGACD